MDIGFAIVKGALQGLTEFLPVSSTAHLILLDTLAKAFHWHGHTPLPGEEEFYDILLHIGTLCAVLVYFRNDLYQIFQQILLTVRAFLFKTPADTPHSSNGFLTLPVEKLPWLLVLSSVVTVSFILSVLKLSKLYFAGAHWQALGIEDLSDFFLAHPKCVATHLMVTGILLLVTETLSQKRQAASVQKPVGYPIAALVGLAQGISAIFHGISRSGSTISTGLLCGLDRETATRYSFLLSIPTFVMATVYETLKITRLGISSQLDWPAMALGMVVSGVVGYACVRYFIRFVARHSLKGFAAYCLVAGFGLSLLLGRI